MSENYSVSLRPEADLKGRWGIYSENAQAWLDVVFTSRKEGLESVAVLNCNAVEKPRRKRPMG